MDDRPVGEVGGWEVDVYDVAVGGEAVVHQEDDVVDQGGVADQGPVDCTEGEPGYGDKKDRADELLDSRWPDGGASKGRIVGLTCEHASDAGLWG